MPSPIFSIFARSPFQPLQQHMEKVYACTRQLEEFLQAIEDKDWDRAAAVQGDINKLEEEADDIKREIRSNLPDGLFMPVARTDVLDLLTRQDRIANKAKDIAGLMLGRKMAVPAPLKTTLMEFTKSSINAAKKARKAIQELDELVETGFRGYEVKRVEEMILKLETAEDEADDFERQIRGELFAQESQMNAVEVMFLYKIIEWIGDIADRSQEVGHRLHLMLAR